METNVHMHNRWIPYEYRAYQALRYYAKHKDARERAENILKRYDLGIDKIGRQGEIIHGIGEDAFKVEVDEESSGTQQLLYTLRMIDSVLAKGSVAIIDEFDAYLHPLMLNNLVERFLKQKQSTKSCAQMLFSTHNHEVLKLLHRQQITLAEKGSNKHNKNASTFVRLDKHKTARSDDNFHNKYLSGAYGAIPKIAKE